MTHEEFKKTLGSITEEGADVAAITDTLLTDYAEQIKLSDVIAEKDAKIAELTSTIASINDTNMKLIERIKYQEETSGTQDEEEPEVTLANLFN